MNLTNIHGLPDALVNAIKNDPYTGGGDISVTKLIDSPQLRVLRKKYASLVVEDVSDRIWALMGQAVHTVLERAGTSALVEERLYRTIDGWEVSGQFDRLHLEDGVLQDWKVCSVYKAKGDAAWERQLNCLRWLADGNNYEVNRLQVVAIFRDWKQSEAKRNPDYPQRNVAIIEVPVWTLQQAESYVRQRVILHKDAEVQDTSIQLAECTEEERWYSGTSYALMKDGGKRAKKVVFIKEELGEIPDGHYVEERPGVNRRCEGYCEVAPFCEQYKRIKSQQQTEVTDDVDF
jgi:hypothetical protein